MKRYAITFGEVAILHIGSKELGKRRNNGFTVDELLQLNDNISDSVKNNSKGKFLKYLSIF